MLGASAGDVGPAGTRQSTARPQPLVAAPRMRAGDCSGPEDLSSPALAQRPDSIPIPSSLPPASPRPSSPQCPTQPRCPPTTPSRSESRGLLERGLDSSSGLGFVRERLALLGKTLFLVSFGFYLFLLASLVLIGGAPFVAVVRGPVALGHLCASLTMALLWLLASRARLSLWSLGALDAVSFVLAGGFLSLMTIEDEGQILQVLLALTVTVMVRAILMPSRPGRTTLLSALVFAPDRRRVHRAPSSHGVPARIQPGLPEAAHDAQHGALERAGDHAGHDRLAGLVRTPPAGRRGERAGTVPARGEDRRGRHGRGLARAPPAADPAGGDQAHPPARAGPDVRRSRAADTALRA